MIYVGIPLLMSLQPIHHPIHQLPIFHPTASCVLESSIRGERALEQDQMRELDLPSDPLRSSTPLVHLG